MTKEKLQEELQRLQIQGQVLEKEKDGLNGNCFSVVLIVILIYTLYR